MIPRKNDSALAIVEDLADDPYTMRGADWIFMFIFWLPLEFIRMSSITDRARRFLALQRKKGKGK